MDGRRGRQSGEPAAGFPMESGDSLLQRAVAVLHSSYLDPTARGWFRYSRAILVENEAFRSELGAFARAKEAAGYSREELQDTFGFLLFDKEEEAKAVCQSGLRVNSSFISTLGDPAKGVYISKHADCLHPRPWHHGESGYIVICKLIKGRVRVIPEDYTTTYTCPSPGYDCHVAESRDPAVAPPGPGQAFEQSQCYVYEVCAGSPAPRPRQVCPYIMLCCQYRDPKDVAMEDLPRRDPQDLYCPWRGQLAIQGKLFCSITLRTPHSCSIPVQLPARLDISHVMALAELREKLPEAAFGKGNYTGKEVCFQGVYSSLYEVEISSKDQQKMDQLVENLKEKDLAIVKHLQDQGVLILLTSSALAPDHGIDAQQPLSLLALFLFTSARSLCFRAEKRPADAKRRYGDKRDIPWKVSSVLPGLRYALRKARGSPWNDPVSPSARIKQHFQDYAKVGPEPADSQLTLPAAPSAAEEQPGPFHECPEKWLCQLRQYLLDPRSYTLALSAAIGSLRGLAEAPPGDTEVTPPREGGAREGSAPQAGGEPAGDSSCARGEPAGDSDCAGGEPTGDSDCASSPGEQGRRKSSRLLMSRKSYTGFMEEEESEGEEDGSPKRRPSTRAGTAASSKKGKATGSSHEPLLKLANLQFPQRRKRGAEVLSAEIVHCHRAAGGAERDTAAPDAPEPAAKRARAGESPASPAPLASPATDAVLRGEEGGPGQDRGESQTGSGLEEPPPTLPADVPPQSQCQGEQSQGSEFYVAAVLEDCDSHGLNLLADLALGSCISLFSPPDTEAISASHSPSSDSSPEQQGSLEQQGDPNPEQQGHPEPASPDPKQQRPGKRAAKAGPPSPVRPATAKPPSSGSGAAAAGDKTARIAGQSSARPGLVWGRAAEGAGGSQQCPIACEHSYALSVPEQRAGNANAKGNPPSGVAPSRNGTGGGRAREGPPVGKVLPFPRPPRPPGATRGTTSPSRAREEFAKCHTVKAHGNSLKVTLRWDGEFLHNLDTRYSNNNLERSVIRALHGPWNCNLPEDLEEMKLILHMWVALFYRKPTTQLSSSRKVVEHKDPKKFVLINSSDGFLDFTDDRERPRRSKTCPADSRSEPDQTPSSSLDSSTPGLRSSRPKRRRVDSRSDTGGVDSTVSSSSGELPCEEEEPSSTSCPESIPNGIPNGIPDAEHAAESPDEGEGQPGMPEEGAWDVPSVAAEELVDATITPGPSEEELGRAPAVPGTENPCSPAPSPCSPAPSPFSPAPSPGAAPWTEAGGDGEQQESLREAGAGREPSSPWDSGDAGCCTEVDGSRDSSWATSDPQGSLPLEASPGSACDSVPSESSPGSARDSVPSEASPWSANPAGASKERLESQDPFGHPEKEERELEEDKEENEEDFEEESTFLGPVDLVLSESSDTEMGSEHSEQKPGNSQFPEDFGVPGEDSVPSPSSLASPCSASSTLVLSGGTWTGNWSGTGSPGLPGEMAPSADELPEPWDAPATPYSETDTGGVASPAHMGSPRDRGEMFPPDPGLFHGAQPDSVTGSSGAAGETLGNALEQRDRDHVPAAERWDPAGNTDGLESPRSRGLAPALSPDSNSACLASPDGSMEPGAAPEDWGPTAGLPSPSRSELGGSSRFSREHGDEVRADLASPHSGDSEQGRSEALGEEEPGSPHSNCPGVPDGPMGAGGGQDFTSDYRAPGDDGRAGEGDHVCPGAENSPGSHGMDVEMAGDAPQEPEMPLHPLLESEPSLEREGMSAVEEAPRQQQSFPKTLSPSSPGYSAPASPAYKEDADPRNSEQSQWEPAPGQPWNCWEEGGAPEGSVSAQSPEGSVNPRCSGGVIRYRAGRPAGLARGFPADVLPGQRRSRSASPPHRLQDGLHGPEPDSVLDVCPGMLRPGTDDASWSSPRASPGSQAEHPRGSRREELILPGHWEGGSGIPVSSPPSSPEGESLDPWHEPHSGWEDSESEAFPDPRDRESWAFPDPRCASRDVGSRAFPDPHGAHTEEADEEIFASAIPALPFRGHRDPSGDSLEFSDAEDPLDTFPRAEQLLGRDTHRGLAFGDPLDLSSSDSEQEYFGRNPRSRLPARVSRGTRAADAAGTRTNGDHFSVEGQGEGWGPVLSRHSRSSVITRHHRRERPGNSQPPRRRRCRAGESHLLQNNLLGDWRGFEELTQNTLDMECLRFHYKLNQVLGNRKPPFSTSESTFPKDLSRPFPRSRSPLQVTIPPSDTWPGGSRSRQRRGRHGEISPQESRRRSPSRAHAPVRLGRLRQDGRPLPPGRGDVTVILDGCSKFQRVVLSGAGARSKGREGREGRGPCPVRAERGAEGRRTAAVGDTIGDLCGALRSQLRRVARRASPHPPMFYLLETGKEPFFERLKALLRKEGWVRMEPLSFCRGRRRASDQLLVIIRNQDISSHLHTIPGLLELKCCPSVLFAGVDSPEDITGHTYQELFHTGGFLVSDHHLLESVSLAQLKEVVKVLEKLNRSGRWKWLLHYRESKKLRGDLRLGPDAPGKQQILTWCQGEGLVEPLPFHACDGPAAPDKELLRCLLQLQVQHVRARLGVLLTQNPGASQEILESKGILVVDVNTFLGTLQDVAAPFQRSYW